MGNYVRSQGAILLVRCGATQEEIAARTGINRVRVADYQSGRRKPGRDGANRRKLCREFNIPEDTWDIAPTAAPAAAASAPPPTPTQSETVSARAERLARMVDELLEGIKNDPKATPLERAKVMASAAATTALLGKLTGESQEIGESRIVRLPAWRRIKDAIVEALRPWPEAMRAVGEKLKALGE